ncbi:MAG: hypothetical protein ACRDTJ_28845 [Pseudonocardiaceae bacterium]
MTTPAPRRRSASIPAAVVDREELTRRRPPRPEDPPAAAVAGLRPSDQTAEVAVRPGIALGLRHRQQPLGADPPLGLLHPPAHQIRDRVVVVLAHHRLAWRVDLPALDAVNHHLHGLVVHAARASRRPIRAELAVLLDDVHPFLR